MTFAQWDPGKCTVSFAGIVLNGFASGTFIKIAYNSDAFTVQAGAQGDTVRVRSRDATGTMEVTLQSSSPCNDLLTAKAKVDRASGTGYGPILATDLNGTSIARASRAWIKKIPDMEWATDPSDRVWVLEIADLELEQGGAVIA